MKDEIKVEMSAMDVGLINAISALAIALKASPGFNNEALVKIAQQMIDAKVPLPFCGPEAEEAYARPLRFLINEHAQPLTWLAENGVKVK